MLDRTYLTHISHIASIPASNVLVKARGIIEHILHFSHRTCIPSTKVLVETSFTLINNSDILLNELSVTSHVVTSPDDQANIWVLVTFVPEPVIVL